MPERMSAYVYTCIYKYIYIHICPIYFQMVCQELCQNSVSRWGSLGESNFGIGTQTDRHRQTQTNKHTHTDRQTQTDTDKHTHTHRHTHTHTHGHTDTHTHRDTHKQDTHTCQYSTMCVCLKIRTPKFSWVIMMFPLKSNHKKYIPSSNTSIFSSLWLYPKGFPPPIGSPNSPLPDRL